jgi:hypothetical protein
LEIKLFNLDTASQVDHRDCRAGCQLCPSGAGNFCLCQILPFLHESSPTNIQTSHTQEQTEEEEALIQALFGIFGDK